jgi:hypothetical protein
MVLANDEGKENNNERPAPNPASWHIYFQLRYSADSWTMKTCKVEGHDCPPYKALSYTWNSPIFTNPEVPYTLTQTIICNRQAIGVGQNL